MAESTENSERLKAKRNVILTAGVAALGGLLFGYDTGVIASALLFWLYAGVGVLTLLFCIRFVPETKGRTLEQIEAEFRARAKRRRVGPRTPTPPAPAPGAGG